MKVRLILKSVVFGLACLGLSVGQTQTLADTPYSESAANKIKINDVALNAEGVFSGIVADKDGNPQAQNEVLIAQGKRVIAKTETNARGEFQVEKLRGGHYQVVVGNQIGHVRVWTNTAAPPNSLKQVVLVSKPIVRGQSAIGGMSSVGGAAGLLTLGAAAATVTLGIVNNNDIGDLQNDVDSIQRQVNEIAKTVNMLTP